MTYWAASRKGRRNYQQDRYLCLHDQGVYLVADGMGGEANGELAAQNVVDAVACACKGYNNEDITIDMITQAFWMADRECSDRHVHRGSTATCVIVREQSLDVIHVGDSRLYCVLPGGWLRQQTKDQGQGHVLSNCIGWMNFVHTDTINDPPVAGWLVLTTDGVHDVLGNELADIVADYDGSDPTDKLVDTAINRGSRDNCTAVVVEL